MKGSGEVFPVGNGVSAPRALETPDPEYSEEARKAKFQGVVVLCLIVGPDGKPRDIKVTRPLGMGLDQKAIEAVNKWRFEPAMKDGRPVAVQINVEVTFRLADSGPRRRTAQPNPCRNRTRNPIRRSRPSAGNSLLWFRRTLASTAERDDT